MPSLIFLLELSFFAVVVWKLIKFACNASPLGNVRGPASSSLLTGKNLIARANLHISLTLSIFPR